MGILWCACARPPPPPPQTDIWRTAQPPQSERSAEPPTPTFLAEFDAQGVSFREEYATLFKL